MSGSIYTIEKTLERLDVVYLNDEKNDVWTPTAKFWAIQSATRQVSRLVADYAPSLVTALSYTVPFVAGTVEYSLPPYFHRAIRLKIQYAGSPPSYETIPQISYAEADGGNGWDIRDTKTRIEFFDNPGGAILLDYVT